METERKELTIKILNVIFKQIFWTFGMSREFLMGGLLLEEAEDWMICSVAFLPVI